MSIQEDALGDLVFVGFGCLVLTLANKPTAHGQPVLTLAEIGTALGLASALCKLRGEPGAPQVVAAPLDDGLRTVYQAGIEAGQQRIIRLLEVLGPLFTPPPA